MNTPGHSDQFRAKAAEDSRTPKRSALCWGHTRSAKPWSAAVLCRFWPQLALPSLLAACFAVQAQAQSPAAAFDAANNLYDQGKYAEAAAAFEKLLSTGQPSPALYFNLGNAFFKSGQIGR